MHRSNRMQPNQNRRHSGFTLIELLVAIGIVAILAGLLLSGIGGATTTVNKAQAAQELRNLETALASFHSEYGMYPPSYIFLYEAPAGWAGDPRSRNLIQKIWPSFDFTISRNMNLDAETARSETPDSTDTFELNGAECLAFFLGGVPQNGALIGFAKNPANPFSTTGNSRDGPFHEFIASRFVDKDSDDFKEYVDTFAGQTSPIVYFSSYDGRGYRSSEITPLLANGIYRQGSATTAPAWKEKTFQLISPGQDGLYGTGGYYSPDDTSGLSQEDADNLTNFTTGTLK
ncbi:type II secretion system protein [uncultured Rubinisphaera sp.]|uniref:type II secretion system protein n=1 Tax=uncultured Rubinisphaera sp. TaxID=1678686 RepID=UPI0030D931EC